ncbi:amino acid ABC transporter permease [Vibrio vulnificus]|nr:amino acid ABC transporter permease [Vibrio vulnificus]
MTCRYLCLMMLLPLTGCSDYQWGWYVLDPTTEQGLTNVKFLIAGFADTISVSLLSMLFAMTLGLMVALPALSPRKSLQRLNRIYVEVIRAIPVLVSAVVGVLRPTHITRCFTRPLLGGNYCTNDRGKCIYGRSVSRWHSIYRSWPT